MRESPMSTDEFATPDDVLAAPKDRDIASVLAFAAAFRTAMGGSLWTVAKFVMAHLPEVIRALNEYFGQQEAIARDLGKKPE